MSASWNPTDEQVRAVHRASCIAEAVNYRGYDEERAARAYDDRQRWMNDESATSLRLERGTEVSDTSPRALDAAIEHQRVIIMAAIEMVRLAEIHCDESLSVRERNAASLAMCDMENGESPFWDGTLGDCVVEISRLAIRLGQFVLSEPRPKVESEEVTATVQRLRVVPCCRVLGEAADLIERLSSAHANCAFDFEHMTKQRDGLRAEVTRLSADLDASETRFEAERELRLDQERRLSAEVEQLNGEIGTAAGDERNAIDDLLREQDKRKRAERILEAVRALPAKWRSEYRREKGGVGQGLYEATTDLEAALKDAEPTKT